MDQSTNQSTTILVVDDDPVVREMLCDYLGSQGYEVLTAADGSTARDAIGQRVPHLVILDVGLPGEDGLSIARYVREKHDIGIIMVSGANEPVDRIIGLEVGSDDYVSKPFDLRELRARVKSVIRRYQRPLDGRPAAAAAPAPGHRVRVGVATLDLDARQLLDDKGEEIPLTASEFDLLKVFSERPMRPLNRDQLMHLTRNRDWDPYDRSIDIRIARLRRKIEPDPEHPRVIKTVRGVGYMFVPHKD